MTPLDGINAKAWLKEEFPLEVETSVTVRVSADLPNSVVTASRISVRVEKDCSCI